LDKQLGIVLPFQMAEKGLRTLQKLALVDRQYRFLRTEHGLLVPLAHPLSNAETSVLKEQIGVVDTQPALFTRGKEPRSRSLSATLQTELTGDLVARSPRSFDVIGDIAILEIPAGMEQFSTTIARAAMKGNPHIRLVLGKSGQTQGQFRVRKFTIIVGEGSTETVHQEFSCRYHLDLSKVYFNPRLSHERMRVAEQVKSSEVVVDMFAGVGPYSILIGKLQPSAMVYSADINPYAYEYLKENVFINRVADHVVPLFGDAKELERTRLEGIAARVIMNLPGESLAYLPTALQILKSDGGVMHFYAFASRSENVEAISNGLREAIREQGRTVESFNFCKVIREVAPNRVQVAIDAVVH
jgi:tRNA (guanine37-N1)-methyltransferase